MITIVYWIMSKMKGGDDMMAMFFAQRVILGKTAFKDVPLSLQPQVKPGRTVGKAN